MTPHPLKPLASSRALACGPLGFIKTPNARSVRWAENEVGVFGRFACGGKHRIDKRIEFLPSD